jgi:protocatechuate 3,4-dioxygenase, beta subunit
MPWNDSSATRRRFLQSLGAGAGMALFTTPGLFAETLKPTASTTEGPFYPDKMPLDTDNDLLIINDAITPAVGAVTHLAGRVLTATGQPVRNAFVEIWQVDSTASYVHSRGRQPTGNDRNFQGYGRFLTDSKGQYYFRTIKPISYTLIGIFRTAHIHFAISRNGRRVFTTQMLVKGLPENARDSVVRGINPNALDTLLVDFKPMAGSKIGELAASFDLVLGKTLAELEDGTLGGGVAISEVQHPRR